MKISDNVLIKTDAIYQPNQSPLNGLRGRVVNIKGENDIQVLLNINKKQTIVSFDKSELTIEK